MKILSAVKLHAWPIAISIAAALGDYAAAFTKESSELAQVAQLGDQAKTKEQFGNLGKTCKACHDDYKNKE